jgi:hypothetical protein
LNYHWHAKIRLLWKTNKRSSLFRQGINVEKGFMALAVAFIEILLPCSAKSASYLFEASGNNVIKLFDP